MGYELFDTCMGVPGILARDCASWVQAWGSLLGLGVALLVPFSLYLVDRGRRLKEDRTRARLLAIGASVDVGTILDLASGAALDIERQIQGGPRANLQLLDKGFKSLRLPGDDEVLQIHSVDPTAALALKRGITRFRQVKTEIGLYATEPDTPLVRQFIESLHSQFDPAIMDLIAAHDRLAKLAGSIPEFELPVQAPAMQQAKDE